MHPAAAAESSLRSEPLEAQPLGRAGRRGGAAASAHVRPKIFLDRSRGSPLQGEDPTVRLLACTSRHQAHGGVVLPVSGALGLELLA